MQVVSLSLLEPLPHAVRVLTPSRLGQRVIVLYFFPSGGEINEKIINPKIKDLKAGMKRVSLTAKVLEIPAPNTVYSRFGTAAYVTNVLTGDETGTIGIALWNEQINTVSEGDIVRIENGRVVSYRGERQPRIERRGSYSIV